MSDIASDLLNMLNPSVRVVARKVFDEVERELYGYMSSQQRTQGKTLKDVTIDVDILKYSDSYKIIADLPGFEKNQVNLYVPKDGVRKVVIKAERIDDSNGEGEYIMRSRSVGSYTRDVDLPDDADTCKMTALMKDGVLYVTVLRKAENNAGDMHKVPIS